MALREPPLVLILGDGDLGYAAALCASGAVPPGRLIATTLEAEAELRRRYTRAGSHIEALRCAGALVLDAVDATALAETLLPRLPLPAGAGREIFSLARFNFPHCPGGLKSLRSLLAGAFASAAPLLTEGGELQVALLAGQGGTPADGERLRAWGDHWHSPLLAARAGLALVRVDAWAAPDGYMSQREPGNCDTGGKEKSFYTDGALVHVFKPCARADMPGSMDLVDIKDVEGGAEVGSDCEQMQDTLSTFQELLRQALPEQPLALHREDLPPEGSGRFGPRLRALRASRQAADEEAEPLRSAVERAARATAGETAQCAEWRWGAAERSAGVQLEVYWERPLCTACFASRTALEARGDWLVVAWLRRSSETEGTGIPVLDLTVDLEVLAMLRFDVQDRRLLSDSFAEGFSGVHPRPLRVLYPCSYVYDLHVGLPVGRTGAPSDASELGAAVVREVRAACRGLLFEAYELPAEGRPESERHWRLVLQAPNHVLDDRAAYAAYQAARNRVAERLGLERR